MQIVSSYINETSAMYKQTDTISLLMYCGFVIILVVMLAVLKSKHHSVLLKELVHTRNMVLLIPITIFKNYINKHQPLPTK
jgi:glucan phosphoethanolaminetransferase (alkaline phosphatase superfamily)